MGVTRLAPGLQAVDGLQGWARSRAGQKQPRRESDRPDNRDVLADRARQPASAGRPGWLPARPWLDRLDCAAANAANATHRAGQTALRQSGRGGAFLPTAAPTRTQDPVGAAHCHSSLPEALQALKALTGV